MLCDFISLCRSLSRFIDFELGDNSSPSNISGVLRIVFLPVSVYGSTPKRVTLHLCSAGNR